MPLPQNILQTVQTYQASELAYLLNLFAFVSTSNKKFKDFENLEANLGDTVTFDLPPRYTTVNGLVATFQESQQRVQNLTVTESANVSYAFSNQQFIFNVKDYMEKFGKSAVAELGTKVESSVAKNAETHTYRFYGDGVTPINSYGQLATALAFFRNYGAAKDNVKGYLDDIAVPSIVNTGLNQFVMKRNEEIANSWQLGSFSSCEWYQSNLLPTHIAGDVGNGSTSAIQTLTVVSTNDPTGANITQITCTCDASLANNPNAIKAFDKAQFVDMPPVNLRYLTWIGHELSRNPVQVRITADAASTGTTVVLNIFPALVSVQNQNQNINHNIVAGMKLKVLPTHRCGLITAGNPLFLAMPRLPEQSPYVTSNATDPDSGVSIRKTYGSLFGQNQMGFINDVIWGSTMVDEYTMELVFPA